MRMCGVLPMVSRTLAAFMSWLLCWCCAQIGCVEALCWRSSGNNHAQSDDHDDRADPAGTPPATGADQRAEEARFRLAELVRGGDGQRRHRADPAAHLVRRVELDQRLADIDREHVGRAEQGEAEQRQRHRARQAEDDRRRAENAHRAQHLRRRHCASSGRTEKKAAVSVAPSAGAARKCPSPSGPA